MAGDKIESGGKDKACEAKSRLADGIKCALGKSKSARDAVAGAAGGELVAENVDKNKHLQEFLKSFSDRGKDKNKSENFAKWVDSQTEPEALIRAGVKSKMNQDHYLEKYIRLASQFLVLEEDKGKTVFKVDFKGNELAEWKLGAGHMLPPNVALINVYNEGGELIFANAKREVKNGKVGYYVNGKYAYVHTGYKIEALGVDAADSSEFQERKKVEDELFDLQEKQTVIKVGLQRFFSDKGVGVSVDDVYFNQKLGDFQKSLPADWWQRYLQGDFREKEFADFFGKAFTAEDLNLMKNVSALASHGKVDLSDFDSVRGNATFSALKAGVFDEAGIAKFKKDQLKDKDLEETLHSSDEVMANEPFVESVDHFGNKLFLRKSAMVAFNRALKIAQSMGVQLKVTSSYRSFARQDELYKQALVKHGGNEKEARKWVAPPGKSNHMTGGTVDVVAMVDGKGGNRHANQKYLWKIFPAAGFVNYELEPWHWEIYSEGWRSKTGKSGPIYSGSFDHHHDH